jgi:hypothetical protein
MPAYSIRDTSDLKRLTVTYTYLPLQKFRIHLTTRLGICLNASRLLRTFKWTLLNAPLTLNETSVSTLHCLHA